MASPERLVELEGMSPFTRHRAPAILRGGASLFPPSPGSMLASGVVRHRRAVRRSEIEQIRARQPLRKSRGARADGLGMAWGVLCRGRYPEVVVVNSHPVLKPVSPQAPLSDWHHGDEWHNIDMFRP